MNDLEKIITWKLSEDETKAYKLALLWTKLLNKHLPQTHKRFGFPKGDPRKTFVFRTCWKLMRETRGILKEENYESYLLAQIFALESISKDGIHASITSWNITGEKAWNRWKWYKRRLEQDRPMAILTESYLRSELKRTKSFFSERFVKLPELGEFSLQNLKEWYSNGDISPIYIMLSPVAKHLLDGVYSKLGFDPKLYEGRIPAVIQDYFHKEFEHEFNILL